MGSVNCYLLKNETRCLLIDTGGSNQRFELVKNLESAGCRPGDLKLIVLTHGDFDHTGNAAYLRQKFGAKLAMHAGDAGMLERGDMSWNRKKGRSFSEKWSQSCLGLANPKDVNRISISTMEIY